VNLPRSVRGFVPVAGARRIPHFVLIAAAVARTAPTRNQRKGITMDGAMTIERPMTLNRAPAAMAAAMPAGPGSDHDLTDSIELVSYRPAWPGQYRVEAEVLRTALQALAPRCEHIGSTAVAGMTAKPIVDILLGVRNPADIDEHAARLRNFGYVLTPHAEYGIAGRRFLVRRVRGARTHHVHVVETFSDAWHRLLLFRDLLRIDPQLAVEYAQLKRALAARHPSDRFSYSAGKTAFIQAVLGVQTA
jgi:GrpB-like predicted nucleotidyltransferase (UPF0157 family)